MSRVMQIVQDLVGKTHGDVLKDALPPLSDEDLLELMSHVSTVRFLETMRYVADGLSLDEANKLACMAVFLAGAATRKALDADTTAGA